MHQQALCVKHTMENMRVSLLVLDFFVVVTPISIHKTQKERGIDTACCSSYLTDPTSPIPSHCAVITLFQSVPVHQLS